MVNSFVNQEKLPSFKKLMKETVCGPLKSTIPPISPPAWASMVTGVNPGKHGVFEFFRFDKRSFEKKIELNPIKTKKIWNYLDEAGHRSIIINFPLMYPPEKVNGITVSGLMTPSSAKYFTYPKHLSIELAKKGYEVEIQEEDLFKLLHSDIDALFNRLIENMEKRAKISLDLLKKYQWDFSMVVFGETDRIQHFFWNNKSLILNSYKKMDETIDRFLRLVDEETVMMVVSDHGFKGITKYFYINSWLAKTGFLSLKKERRGPINREKLQAILGRLYLKSILKHIPSRIGRRIPNSQLRTSNIAFSKTKAYSTSGYGYIILKDEKNNELTDKLIQELMEIKDPNTNEKIVNKVLRKKEVFSGPFLKDAPDLIVIPADGHVFHDKFVKDELFEEPEYACGLAKRFGEHADRGVLFIFGDGVRNKEKAYRIYDITPTVLDFFDIHCDNLDGISMRNMVRV